MSLALITNLTGNPANIASYLDLGTRSMTPAPTIGQVNNRVGITGAVSGYIGVGATGTLVKLSLTGDTRESSLIYLTHTNTGPVGGSDALHIDTNVTSPNLGTAIQIINTGQGDNIHLLVNSPASGTPAPTGLGIDMNTINYGGYAGYGIQIANRTNAGSSAGTALKITNTGTDLANQIRLIADGNNLNISPINDAAPNNTMILLRNAAWTVDKFWVLQSGEMGSAGVMQSGKSSASTGALRLGHASSVHYTTIRPGNATASVTYTLPTTDGPAGSVLQTNGAGVLSWKP